MRAGADRLSSDPAQAGVMRVQLARDVNAVQATESARAAVDESFWTMLGVPRQPIDLTLTYVSS